ncbi:MAG TPA: hypothetical protein VGL53_31265 [Bryobacteraceae bacterium]
MPSNPTSKNGGSKTAVDARRDRAHHRAVAVAHNCQPRRVDVIPRCEQIRRAPHGDYIRNIGISGSFRRFFGLRFRFKQQRNGSGASHQNGVS